MSVTVPRFPRGAAPALRASASRAVLALLLSGLAAPALAASFTVPSASGAQSVSGTDTGTIESGQTLTGGSSVAITWSGAATGDGVVITNHGTVAGGSKRAIDTASSVSGLFTLNNDGTISSTGDDAFRINSTLAGGTVVINNSGSITSGGGQALDFNKATATTATVTINNTGGIISSSDSDAIRVGGGTIDITNSGTIESTSGDRAIKMDTDTNFDTLVSLTITNEVGGTIRAEDDAIKISSSTTSTAAPTLSIDNSGLITSIGDGQAIDLGDISSTSATITITNRADGEITSTDNGAIKGADGMVVYNYGNITSNSVNPADDSDYSAIRISGKDVDGGMTATVYNYDGATISGAYHGIKASGSEDVLNVTNYEGGTIEGRNGAGVNSNGTGTVTNYGLITGNFDPAATFGDGDAVDFDGAATVYNYGEIKGLGSKGIKEGETDPSLSEGIAIGGGTIVNGDADHTEALISGANNGILADNSDHGDAFAALSVTNYGTIEGLDGFGIQMVNDAGTFSNTIINYGTISGTSFAVSMGNGDDLFVYEAGSSVSGTVYAEGGTDTFKLGEVAGTFDASLLGPAATYQDFETLALASGSTWTVTGSSDFAGATQVEDATLILSGASLAMSGFSVTDGTLAGTGTIGSLAAGAGAVISPGTAMTPVGTLSVNGNASFASGSTYVVSVTPAGESDLIAATGTAAIDTGAAVQVEGVSGTYSWETRTTILSADGGVTGTFGSVSSNYLFLTPTLAYTDTTVDLTLQRNDVSFASYGATANARAAANAVQRSDPYSGLYEAVVVGTSAAQVGLALTQLSGDIYGTLPGVLFNQNLMVNDTILSRLRQAGYAGSQGATAPLAFGGPVTAYADEAKPAAMPFKAIKAPVQPQGPAYATWAQGYGQWLNMDSTGNAVSADAKVGGILVGADATFATLGAGAYTFGLAAGYSSGETSTASATADTDTAHIAAYAGAAFDAFKLRAGATYGWSSTDSQRYVALVNERPEASFDGTAANLFAEAGYTIAYGTAAFEPFAGIGWTSVDQDGFTETGAPISGLTSLGTSFSTAYSTLGLRAGFSYALDNGMTLRPRASAAWRHAFGDVNPEAVLAFTSTATAFGIEGLPIAADSLVLDAGIDLLAGQGFTVSVGYEGAFGDNVSSNAAKGTVAYRF